MAEERRRARLKIYATLAVLGVLGLTSAWPWPPLREYADPRWLALATILGMLPGNLLFTAFGRQLRQMIASPTPTEVAVTAAITLASASCPGTCTG